MQMMEYEDSGLMFECILHLSLFLRPGLRLSEGVQKTLQHNSQQLIEIIQSYQPPSQQEEDFAQLKAVMLDTLNKYSAE